MTPGPFGRRALAVLSGMTVLSLAAFLYASIAEHPPDPELSAGANAFSRSAVGHRGFVELLREMDVPVTVSRWDSGGRSGASAVLIVAEPRVDSEEDERRLRRMVQAAERVLVVLPKREPLPDRARRGFVRRAGVLPASEPQAVLEALGIEAEVFRGAAGLDLGGGASGPGPLVARPQLATGGLERLLGTQEGILLGAVPGSGEKRLVLCDPDPIANHGIGKGENAAFAIALVERLGGGDLPVFVDETLHGFETPPRLFSAFLRFPLLAVTLTGLLALALAVAAGAGRFGAPRPEEPAIDPGKGMLLTNTAKLLAAGSHAGYVVSRYLQATLGELARARHAPGGLSEGARIAWLTRWEEGRRLTHRAAALAQAAKALKDRQPQDSGRALGLARRIHRYREETEHGA